MFHGLLITLFTSLLSSLSSGNSIVPAKEKIITEAGLTITLQWACNFPLPTGKKFITVLFKPPNHPEHKAPLVFISDGKVESNRENTDFFHKIKTTKQPHGVNGFKLFIDISNIGIAEEGVYRLRHFSLLSGTDQSSTISVGVIVTPVIQKRPASISKRERDNVTFPCITTSGNPKPLTFQWHFTGIEKNERVALTEKVKAYDTHYLNISNVGYMSIGKYECTVSNGHGGQDAFAISLNVKHTPYVRQPLDNITVFESDGLDSMFCDAIGNPTLSKYYWYSGEKNLIEITTFNDHIRLEAKDARLKFRNPPRNLATKYWCAGENIYGKGTPRGAYLNVTYVPGAIEFPSAVREKKVTNGLEYNILVVNGNEGTNLTVKCYSDANPPATYIWSRTITNTLGQKSEKRLVVDSPTGELVLRNIQVNDTGEYKCEAYNYPTTMHNIPKRYSEQGNVRIKVNYGPLRTNITVNGRNQSHKVIQIKENSAVEIRCESDSEPPAQYNIKYGNTNKNPDINIGLYKIEKFTIPEEGDYMCIASNNVLRTNQTKKIKVLVAIEPTALNPIPTDRVTEEKSTVYINCHAKGRPEPKVFWTKDQRNITNFNDGVIAKTLERKPGRPNDREYKIEASLVFTGIRSKDEGKYACVVHNGAGRISIESYITVNYAPKFKEPLKNLTVREEGEQVVFTCSVEAKPNNNIQYKWFFRGINDKEKKLIPHISTSQLKIGIPKRKDNGYYQCEATNLIGNPTLSSMGKLVVTYPPKITSITSNKTVNEGDSFALSCQADGMPEPSYEWKKEGDNEFKGTSNVINLQEVTHKNKGKYFCNVKNSVGSDSKNVLVFVRHKPIIVTNTPSDTKIGIDAGQTVELVCGAEGFPVPGIKWTKKSSNTLLSNGEDGFTIISRETMFGRQSRLSFRAKSEQIEIGTKFTCQADNERGSDTEDYQILKRGKPDPPQDLKVTDVILPAFPITVNITVTWTPGFSGGYPVEYYLHYREKNQFVVSNFLTQYVGTAPQNKYVFQKRKPGTEYIFAIVAKNRAGTSPMSKTIAHKTTVPPEPVATFEVRKKDDTSVVVHWNINKPPVVKSKQRRSLNTQTLRWDYGLVRYRIVEQLTWEQDKILNIPQNGTHVVENLQATETYEFYFVLYDSNGEFATPISAGKSITPGGEARKGRGSGISKTDIIVIGVGCGGALLIIIVIIIFVAIYIRGKNNTKYNYNQRVQVDIPVSTISKSTGYNSRDVVRTNYGEEDDPFAVDSTVLDESNDKSAPPDYNSVHRLPDASSDRDYSDHGAYERPPNSFHPDNSAPSYTSFGRLNKKPGNEHQNDNPYSKSMMSLGGPRSSEISRDRPNKSLDNLDEYEEKDISVPLLENRNRKTDRKNKSHRNSRGRLSSDEDLPNHLRSPPSDEGRLNRAPGAFAAGKKKPPPKVTPDEHKGPSGFHQAMRSNSPAPSSVASSKPYRSDNEYIDDQDDKYVGFLV